MFNSCLFSFNSSVIYFFISFYIYSNIFVYISSSFVFILLYYIRILHFHIHNSISNKLYFQIYCNFTLAVCCPNIKYFLSHISLLQVKFMGLWTKADRSIIISHYISLLPRVYGKTFYTRCSAASEGRSKKETELRERESKRK